MAETELVVMEKYELECQDKSKMRAFLEFSDYQESDASNKKMFFHLKIPLTTLKISIRSLLR